jgi:hypothetical protein
MKETKDGLEIQFNTNENEKHKEKLAADQFFSSLLETRSAPKSLVGDESQCPFHPVLSLKYRLLLWLE